MTRLYVIGEGLTEISFVREVVRPLIEKIAPGDVWIQAIDLGGRKRYQKLKKAILNLLAANDRPIVTTMIDLFNLPKDFPGRNDPENEALPLERVNYLESSLAADIDNTRFVPYLQLHEFEALVLCGLDHLAKLFPHRRQTIAQLKSSVERFESPEHIDRLMPPSYCIQQAIPNPEYQKVVHGIQATLASGIEPLRARCQHFDQWLTRLENLPFA